MIPKILCRKCGAEILPSDKFCSACGLKISWGAAADAPTTPPAPPASNGGCPFCGSQNTPGASFCESCGAALGGQAKAKPASAPKNAKPSKVPLSFFQSWKLTALIGLVLLAVILVFKGNRKEEEQPTMPAAPQAAVSMSQIESLERAVEAHPGDTLAVLHLANMLYDARLFPRATVMYNRYLKANPANADARVDLGVAYFEMSFLDTLKAQEYLSTAAREMEKALTFVPNHQLACFNLGIISFHIGDNQRALGWFKKCVAIDPSSETGKRAQQFFTQHQLTQ